MPCRIAFPFLTRSSRSFPSLSLLPPSITDGKEQPSGREQPSESSSAVSGWDMYPPRGRSSLAHWGPKRSTPRIRHDRRKWVYSPDEVAEDERIDRIRSRKSVASSAELCPRDLNEIPYIAWMNKQIDAGRKPAGPLPDGAPGAGDTLFKAPRDVPTRGRRDADRVASSRVVEDDAFDDDAEDSEYNDCDDDADSSEEEDKGMPPSGDEDDADEDADDDEDVPDEAQPATPSPRRSHATAAAGTNTAAKGGEPPRAAAKNRNLHPVKRSVWSHRESTIFVAARWFMKDKLGKLLAKQGSQY
ncbi:unnamed protein product [Closterium sp. NIES-65]|nr:unnamed protein product [Closterium sp. NIES-65]